MKRNPTTDGEAIQFLVHAMGHIAFDAIEGSPNIPSDQLQRNAHTSFALIRTRIREISFWYVRANKWGDL